VAIILDIKPVFPDARIPLLNVASMLSCNGTIVSMGTMLVVLDPYQTFHPQSVGK